jgi:hypothetical protein
MLHGRRASEEDWIANSSLSIDMATLFQTGLPAARVRLAVNFRDLSDHYSEHGIGLVNGHVEGSLVC